MATGHLVQEVQVERSVLTEPGPGAEELAELLLALVAVPSPTGQEGAVAELAEQWLAESGLRVERRGYGLLAAAPPDERPTLALVGHLDTVPWGGARPPSRDAERIWGRGACDMKAGVACILWLARHLPPDQGPYRLLHVLYDREEGPYLENGLEPLLAHSAELRAARFALVLEPTGGAVQLGALGSLHVKLTVHGRAAHSARPWLGRSAIGEALPLLAELGGWPIEEVELDGLRYRPSLTVTRLTAGLARNVVPDRLEANVNVRFAPDTTPEAALARVAELVARRGELELVDRSPAARPHRDHPILQALLRQFPLPVEPKQAWTDVARLQAWGIPAANFGPGRPELAHTDDEHLRLAELFDFFATLQGFCAGEGAR